MPFEVARMYLGIKLHFTTRSYNYFKYNGQIKTFTQEHFEKRRDQTYFHKLSKAYEESELQNFFVANVLSNSKAWVGELVTPQAQECYRAYVRQMESLGYLFEQEMRKLVEKAQEAHQTLDQALVGNPPLILSLYYRRVLGLQTMVILNQVFKKIMIKKIDAQVTDTLQWPKAKLLIEKYEWFLPIEARKYAEIVRKVMKEA